MKKGTDVRSSNRSIGVIILLLASAPVMTLRLTDRCLGSSKHKAKKEVDEEEEERAHGLVHTTIEYKRK